LIDASAVKVQDPENPLYKKYFMHGTSHYLGLDVHDPGTYGKLAAGQVITVEPGIYIPDGSPCDPKWWNIGIRIEDDVLITDSGYEVMSSCIPKTIAEIERIMAQSGVFDELVPGK
jgi:Xaa-Pro aminopeptidase